MQIQPCDSFIEASSSQIGIAVKNLLRECGVTGPPTPLDDLLQFRRLVCTPQHTGVLVSMARHVQSVAHGMWDRLKSRVAGILDLRSRSVLVNPHLHHRRQTFVAYHEIGHEVLPWHRDLFVVTSEAHLSPDIRRVFEAEANNFAAQAIFQGDHLAHGYRGTQLRMAGLAGLAATYGASLTATARHYVGVQDIPTALVVGKRVRQGELYGIVFRYGVGNQAFLREFAPDIMGLGFRSSDLSCTTVNDISVSSIEDVIPVTDLRNETRTLTIDTLYNSYETLTLVHAIPMRRSSLPAKGSSVRHLLRRAIGRRVQ